MITIFCMAWSMSMQKIGQSSFFLIWAIATGILTGCAIVLIRLIAGSLEEVFLFHNYPVSLTPILIFAPLAGIAVSCAIKSWLSHSNSSADMTLLIQSIRERNPKLIKLETLSHIFASSLTVGTGGSAGLTTPSVLTGASIGGNIGRMLHIAPDKSIRLMSCGPPRESPQSSAVPSQVSFRRRGASAAMSSEPLCRSCLPRHRRP